MTSPSVPLPSLQADGVPSGAAPTRHMSADPWDAIRPAVQRTTGSAPSSAPTSGSAGTSPDLFLTPLDDPGGHPASESSWERPPDLCLLAVPLAEALTDLSSSALCATFPAGRRIH